jgi:protein-disulfide isomerase
MAGQKNFYRVLGIVALVGVAWLGWKMVSGPNLPVRVATGVRDTSGFTGYVLGSPDAPVEIVEYADFQCPQCADFDLVQMPDIKRRLIDTGKLRLVIRDFPLDQVHPEARLSAHAVACAADQGRFEQMKFGVYSTQARWSMRGDRKAYGILGDAAEQAGVNRADWEACMEAGSHAARIEASLAEGVRVGVGSTPTLLIDGRLHVGRRDSDVIVSIVDSLIAKAAPTQ